MEKCDFYSSINLQRHLRFQQFTSAWFQSQGIPKVFPWKYIEFFLSSRLSWRRTAVFLTLYFFISKINYRQKLGTSDKLWLRWCFIYVQFNKRLIRKKRIIILWIVPGEILSCFLGKSENSLPKSTRVSSLLYSSPRDHRDKRFLISAFMFSHVAFFWML